MATEKSPRDATPTRTDASTTDSERRIAAADQDPITRRRLVSVLGTSAVGGGLASASVSTPAAASSHEADVYEEGGTWHAEAHGSSVYSGGSMFDAVRAAIDGLSSGRSSKETVVVHDGGSASGTVYLPSYTALEFREPVDHGGSDMPFYADQEHAIEITSLTIDTTAGMGMRIQRCSDVTLGSIEITGGPGLGIRIDGGRSMGLEVTENVGIGDVYVEETGSHGVETYNVDDIEIGTVTARDTGGCGLLLNATSNADVGLVDAVRANEGGGYAGFRCANDAGPNIHVDEVYATDCGRGIFTVSSSRGITVEYVELVGNGGNLIENTQDVEINGGLVEDNGGEGFRVHGRSDTSHHPTRNVTIRNCGIYGHDYGIRETGPGTGDNAFVGNDLCENGTDFDVQSSETVVEDNTSCEYPDLPGPCEDAEPTPIDPYLRVGDGDSWGEWRNASEVEIEPGQDVELGPQPVEAEGWSWSGPGVDATTREIVVSPEESSTYTATYTNDCDETSTQAFTVVVAASDCGGVAGAESAQVDGQTVCDLGGDGLHRDVTGDGSLGQDDVVTFFENQHREAWQQPDLFDFSENGSVGHGDVVALFEDVVTS